MLRKRTGRINATLLISSGTVKTGGGVKEILYFNLYFWHCSLTFYRTNTILLQIVSEENKKSISKQIYLGQIGGTDWTFVETSFLQRSFLVLREFPEGWGAEQL